MAHAETSAGRSPGPAEAVAVLAAGGTMGFAIARRLSQATAEHGDEDVSAIYQRPRSIRTRGGNTMPKIRRRGLAQAGKLPATLKRSSKEAQETFTEAQDSAVQAYGAGDQADRAAYAEFKRTYEKRGDHWIPKQLADPGD